MKSIECLNCQDTSSSRKRFRHECKKGVALLVGGLLYGVWCIGTGLYIPCIFRLCTGLKCPACGISHMAVHLMEGQVRQAFWCNPCLFLLLPILLLLLIRQEIRYIRYGKRSFSKLENVILYCMIVGLLLFGIIRNF